MRDAPLLVFLAACLGLMAVSAYRGCAGERPPPPPPADPKLVEQRLDTYLTSDDVLNVKLENAGRDGWVRIDYRTWVDVRERRREPDAVKWMKNTFTSEGSNGYRVEERSHASGNWAAYTWMRGGETKWVSVALPGHGGIPLASGRGHASATAVDAAPKDAVLR